jgi:hypothetical protein
LGEADDTIVLEVEEMDIDNDNVMDNAIDIDTVVDVVGGGGDVEKELVYEYHKEEVEGEDEEEEEDSIVSSSSSSNEGNINNRREREPYNIRTPYVDHFRHNTRATNHNTNINSRYTSTNRPTNTRPHTTSQLLSYVLYPTNQSLFSDVIVHPSESEILNATELINYSDNTQYNNNTCPITLEEFNHGERICQIKHCGHIFREEALRNWFRRNVRCPVCRYDIRNYVNANRNTDISNNDLARNARTNILGIQYATTESDSEDSENDEIIEPTDNTSTMPPIPDSLTRNLTNILVDYINNHIGPSMSDISGGFTHTFELPIFYYSDNSGYYFDSSNNSDIV